MHMLPTLVSTLLLDICSPLGINELAVHVPTISFTPVPADGVKGKTWGPSTASSAVRARPALMQQPVSSAAAAVAAAAAAAAAPSEAESRWSQSAPSLEKRNLSALPSVTSVPEIGKRDTIAMSLQKTCPRLRDPASRFPPTGGASSRNLAQALLRDFGAINFG